MGRYSAHRIRELTPQIAALIERVDEVLANEGDFTRQELADAERTVDAPISCKQAELPL
jgi:ElaB/YqjD/DUF883 family membrane-anchored ribosome-binding protein